MFLSALLNLVVLPLLTGAITACPQTEIPITTTDGAQWMVCANADYQTSSVLILNSIKSRNDCAQLCDQYSGAGGCSKAVYDKTNFICHIKGNPINTPWATNVQYDSIRLVTKPITGQAVTSCPSGAYNTTLTDASTWSVCPNTDFQGNTLSAQGGITSESACAYACASEPKCQRAVYDAKNLDCYLKDGTASQWVYNTQYETIRVVSRPQQGSALSSCPAGDQNFTVSSGRGFALCQNTDLSGPSTLITGGVASGIDCAQICDQSHSCSRAVYSAGSQTCYLKPDNAAWVLNSGFAAIRLVNGTSSFTGNRGKWAPVVNLPVVPAGAFVVPEQPVSYRILGFSSWGTFQFSGPTGITQFADYNWNTGAVSQRTITNTQHDMFCPGMSYLANGTLVVNGGENAEAVSFFNYETNSFTRAANMEIPRGYQSSTTLSDGRIFTIGGSFTGGIGGKTGEAYDPVANAWTVLPGCDVTPMLTTYDAEGPWRTDNHAWLYGWKNGYVFQAGPSKSMHWYSTTNGGSVASAGTRDAANDTMCGVNVMYDALNGKIFTAGGSQSYTNSAAFARAHLITINTPGQAAGVESLPDMHFQRGFANAVVLPNGQVVITGGQVTSLVFTDIQSVLAPELWDPTTKQFTILAPAVMPRNYHSIALLLADGRVLTGGGGLCPVAQGASSSFCDMNVDHFNVEIFTPPYLLNADGTDAVRPSISALSSNSDSRGYSVRPGGVLTVDMKDGSGATFSLVRLGSSTHSINTDQRRIPLTNIKANKTRYTIVLPSDPGVVIPGYYYLFALNTAGTPGVARTIQVS